MFSLPISVFFTAFATIGIALIFFLWIYYDRFGIRQADRRHQTVFSCVRCGHLYSTHQPCSKAACPRCQFENIPLKF